jgi:phosphoribosylformylglycinamidine cyclo-ligase
VLPPSAGAEIDRSTWAPLPIFGLVGGLGRVDRAELERALNMGVGMVAVVAPQGVDRARRMLIERGVYSWAAGRVTPGPAGVRLVGDYAA